VVAGLWVQSIHRAVAGVVRRLQFLSAPEADENGAGVIHPQTKKEDAYPLSCILCWMDGFFSGAEPGLAAGQFKAKVEQDEPPDAFEQKKEKGPNAEAFEKSSPLGFVGRGVIV
jgi:hypothetical protein